jgi:O-antigen/teichoic acid export membrane protein
MDLNLAVLKDRAGDPLYRNSLFLMGNTVITTGLGFLFWMVVARYYNEYEVGVAAAIISAVSLLGLISSLGLETALIRFLPKSSEPASLINSCLTVNGTAALLVAGIFLAGVNVFSPATAFVRENPMFILVFVIFAVAGPLSSIVDSIFIAKRRAEFTLAKSSIFSLLKIPLPIALAVSFRAFGIVSSWGIAAGIALLTAFALFLPRVQANYRPALRVDLSILRAIWRYSTGNYFATLLAVAPPLILPIMIVNLVSGQQNAYFYVAWMIAGLLQAIPIAISQSLFAEGSHFEDRLAFNAWRAFKFAALLLVPAILVILLAGKWLLLIFGESYSSNAQTLLMILALSSMFTGVNNIYYTVLRVRGRIRELIALRAVVALVVLTVSGLIVTKVGIVGIGYAWIGMQAVVSIYIILKVRSRLRGAGHPAARGEREQA